MNLFNFIKANLSIMEVVGEYASLKKAGLYWKGHCPFHNEKTASFTVSPHKEIYYCFGCNMGGDVIAFIARAENCTPIEAAKFLIDRHQLNPPENLSFEQHEQNPERKKQYYDLCKAVAMWCHDSLLKSPTMLSYLHKRGFTKDTINYFNIGYFPGSLGSVKNLTQAMTRLNFLPTDLVEANILSEGKTVLYSPFEDRIIFPIKDHLGRYCAFGGRIFKPQDERPKYYNSRENEHFIKGALLFNLDLAKKSIQETQAAFLVEGYTDCMAMVQHGYANTVATLGTACTAEHLKLLARHAQHLYVVYDGDKAGHQAILRLTELCWQVSMELKVICLPAKEDPASYLGKGNDLKPLIAKAQDIFVFFIESLGTEFSGKPLSEKIALIRKLVNTINTLDDPLTRDILLQRASKILEVPLETMQNELARSLDKRQQQAHNRAEPPAKPNQPVDGTLRLEKKIFCAIINNMKLFNTTNDQYLIEYLPVPLRDILKKLKLLKDINTTVDFIQFFDTLADTEKQYVSRLLLEHDQDMQLENFEQLLLQLHKKNWKVIVHDIKVKLAQAKSEGDDKTIEKILKDFLELKQTMLGKNII